MLGVRRASINQIASEFEAGNIINTQRGQTSIVDGEKLEAASCECYAVVKKKYDRLLPTPETLPSGSTMAKIQKRGRLVAGVSADTYLLGSRNPFTGTWMSLFGVRTSTFGGRSARMLSGCSVGSGS